MTMSRTDQRRRAPGFGDYNLARPQALIERQELPRVMRTGRNYRKDSHVSMTNRIYHLIGSGGNHFAGPKAGNENRESHKANQRNHRNPKLLTHGAFLPSGAHHRARATAFSARRAHEKRS